MHATVPVDGRILHAAAVAHRDRDGAGDVWHLEARLVDGEDMARHEHSASTRFAV